MEAVGRELALHLSTGPREDVRPELNVLLPGVIALVLQIELTRSPTRVMACTPDILAPTTVPWQLHLTPDASRDFQPLIRPNTASISSSTAPISLWQRPLDNDQVQLLAQILHLDEAHDLRTPRQIGILIATGPATALLLRPSPLLHANLLALAAAISTHSVPLESFSTSVGRALFDPPHTSSENSLLGSSDDDPNSNPLDFAPLSDVDNGSNEEDTALDAPFTQNHHNNTTNYPASTSLLQTIFFRRSPTLWPPPVDTAASGLSAGLSFLELRHEASFQRWHAAHMLHFDFMVLCMSVALQTVIVFTSATNFNVTPSVPWYKWLVGYVEAVVIGVLCTRRGRQWYILNRDALLLCLLAVMFVYHHSLMKNFQGIGTPAMSKCSGVAYGFLWLPYVTFVFQARFKWLAPMIVMCAALNLSLLGEMCGSCVDDGTSMKRCVLRGASKVTMMVAAALGTVYYVEWRARRVWAALRVRDTV